MRISKTIEFDAGHRVATHGGQCQNLHGHRYKLEVEVEGEVPADGMVIDYGVLKRILMDYVHAKLDHGFIVDMADQAIYNFVQGCGHKYQPMTCPPTAENIVVLILQWIAPPLSGNGLKVTGITLWETPSSKAMWP